MLFYLRSLILNKLDIISLLLWSKIIIFQRLPPDLKISWNIFFCCSIRLNADICNNIDIIQSHHGNITTPYSLLVSLQKQVIVLDKQVISDFTLAERSGGVDEVPDGGGDQSGSVSRVVDYPGGQHILQLNVAIAPLLPHGVGCLLILIFSLLLCLCFQLLLLLPLLFFLFSNNG